MTQIDGSRPGAEYMAKSEFRSEGRAVRPRDSSTLILVRRDTAEPTLLMGKRSAKHRFMPNKFVFPGGVVDLADSRLKPHSQLHPAVLARLIKGASSSKAQALALAAIRETFEETGLILGEPAENTVQTRSPQWRNFLRHELTPKLDSLHFFARAITPPYRGRRYDTRFFMADADSLKTGTGPAPEASGELLQLHWVTLAQARELELPHITRIVLDEVEQRITNCQTPEQSGPFIYFRHGKPVMERH